MADHGDQEAAAEHQVRTEAAQGGDGMAATLKAQLDDLADQLQVLQQKMLAQATAFSEEREETAHEVSRLKEALAAAERGSTQQRAQPSNSTVNPQSQPSITVHVKAPTAPKLGVFTGVKPSGGGEVSFREWRDKAEAYLRESPEEGEAFSKLRGSVRGLAAEQTKACKTVATIFATLEAMYGNISTPEDLLLDFSTMQMNAGEAPSAFLSRLWAKLVDINSIVKTKFTKQDINHKLYHVFLKQMNKQNPLLALEVRGMFGLPGVASPEASEVLRRTRELETDTGEEKKKTARANVTTITPELDYDKLADLVAKKIKGQGGAERGRACYRCGSEGHLARQCGLPRQDNACFKCGGVGHYARVCKSGNGRQSGGEGNH